MHRHGLRRIFDAAQGEKCVAGTHRIVGITVRTADAAYALRVAFQHAIEQAHVAAVRDDFCDCGFVR